MGELDTTRQPIFLSLDRDDRIQSKQCEVGQVVLGDAVTPLGRDDEAETSKARGAASCSAELWDEDLVGISDDDLLNLASAGDQQTELTPTFTAEFTEPGGSLRVDESILGNPSSVEAFDSLGLVGLEALSIAMEFGRNEARP